MTLLYSPIPEPRYKSTVNYRQENGAGRPALPVRSNFAAPIADGGVLPAPIYFLHSSNVTFRNTSLRNNTAPSCPSAAN